MVRIKPKGGDPSDKTPDQTRRTQCNACKHDYMIY